VFTKLARIGIGLAAMVLAGTTFALAETSATPASSNVAQATPAPSASPNPFSYRGYIRAYDLTRQNAYSGTNGNGKVNQQSFEPAISLHAEYNYQGSGVKGLGLGASYLYGNPLNNCSSAVSHLTPPCGNVTQPNLNPDDTLPGYELNTLYEAYLQYKSSNFFIKLGDQVNPSELVWTPASDTRVKPSAYRGGYATYAFNKEFTVEAGDWYQWEARNLSDFNSYTLLTDNPAFPYPGATGLSPLYFNPARNGIQNGGVYFGRAAYTGPKNAPLTASATFYGFNQIVNTFWLDARYPFALGNLKPFVALQFGSEGNPSNGVLGKINSQVIGLQGGINVLPNVVLTVAGDYVPIKTDTLSAAQMAAGGVLCGANGVVALNTAAGAKANHVNFPYFLPTGGTGQCSKNSDGSTNIYYGGWASPYTDSYATDVFFTTELTQGMVDRRSPGTSAKAQLTFTSNDKRAIVYINHGWFDYNNNAFANSTQETDFDALYYFNALPKSGPYKGFSFRYRYGERDQSPIFSSPLPAPGVSLFKYNRFQAEYDF
jgi:hypothetical protein